MIVDNMDKPRHSEDYEFAQKICKELRAGRRGAIEGVYNRYQGIFQCFLSRRIRGEESQQIGDILNRFWGELLNGKAICSFQGHTSLKLFLLNRLDLRIIDEWRRAGREKRYVSLSGAQYDECTEDERLSAAAFSLQDVPAFGRPTNNPTDLDRTAPNENFRPPQSMSPEQKVILKERDRLVRETLLDMSEKYPRDAELVKMHLEGLSYRHMASRELAGTDPEEEELNKRLSAVKKRFTRPHSGSLAKFRKMLLQKMKQKGLDVDDLIL